MFDEYHAIPGRLAFVIATQRLDVGERDSPAVLPRSRTKFPRTGYKRSRETEPVQNFHATGLNRAAAGPLCLKLSRVVIPIIVVRLINAHLRPALGGFNPPSCRFLFIVETHVRSARARAVLSIMVCRRPWKLHVAAGRASVFSKILTCSVSNS